jgi:hypothetical protein
MLATSARWWVPLLSRAWGTASAQFAGQGVLVLLFALSIGRVLAVPFQPFLYFRF